MRYRIVNKPFISSTIELPLSKSISNRALVLNTLSQCQEPIPAVAQCDDTDVMLKALHSNSHIKDVGAAGTSMRFLTAYYAQKPGQWIMTGSERMKNRPIAVLVDALHQAGAAIQYLEKEGYPPLQINGKELEGGTINLDGSISSQYLSALMMIAPTMQRGLTLELTKPLTSRPYFEMTKSMLAQQGIDCQEKDNTIQIPAQPFSPHPIRVEADWSAASYWYEIVAISQAGEIHLVGLQPQSTQGDSQLVNYYEQLGVETVFTPDGVTLKPTGRFCQKLELDLKSEPDIAQTLVVTCALLNIPFQFEGLHTLRIKETDRLHALQTELGKMGYSLDIVGDSILRWDGHFTPTTQEICIDTYEDHRMAMAFAPAAIKLQSIVINEPMVVTKSYPGYYQDLKNIGLHIEEVGQ